MPNSRARRRERSVHQLFLSTIHIIVRIILRVYLTQVQAVENENHPFIRQHRVFVTDEEGTTEVTAEGRGRDEVDATETDNESEAEN